jgi:ATP-dependent DNA helicase RecQ
MTQTPESVLKEYWGFDTFRPMQHDIIQSALNGRDTLALLPTGGGKSICFQVPALCTEGVCVVISPLIALMKDQVQNLKNRGIAAAAIFSGMNYRDIDRLFDNAVYGGLKFLYISPERLMTELAIERIKRMKVSFIAVDEAHCISQWGYDFRPSYLQIANIRDFLPNTPIIALTATATTDVVKDICQKLTFKKDFQVFQQDFNRPNLSYVVRNVEQKEAKLLEILTKTSGSGIIYVRNRKRTKELANFLQSHKISADFYHAGLTPEERSQRQDDWIDDKTRIIVSTNAFGMGIDKPNVRTVVHLDLPDSLEGYFQEAGRGGRDGQKAYAVLLFNKNDVLQLEYQFEMSFPEMREIKQVYGALGSYLQLAVGGGIGESFDFNIVEFTQRFNFDVLKAYACFRVLEQDGWLAFTEGIFLPAAIKIVIDREKLYDYQLKNRSYDLVLKGILRAFQGVLNDFVSFNELSLAQFLKMSVIDLEKILNHLTLDGIIEYRHKKDKPQLTFLRERVDNQSLTIDYTLYMFRKKRAEYRMRKAIEYAELGICRSQQLLQYFGQTDSKPCGVCDICIEQEKNALDSNDFDIFKEKISRLLKREPLTLKEIVDSFTEKHRTKVIQTIGFLLDEGLLKKELDKFRLKE